jgi:hypothetical protein
VQRLSTESHFSPPFTLIFIHALPNAFVHSQGDAACAAR